jgi:putative tricarboxylic transport membrane protein
MIFTEKKVNSVIAIMAIAFSILMVITVIPTTIVRKTRGLISTHFFPSLISIAIGVCGVVLLVDTIRNKRDKVLFKIETSEFKSVLSVVGVTVGFVIAVMKIGFLLGAAIATGFYLYVFNERRKWMYVIFIIVLPLVIYLFFESIMGLRLPKGSLFS